MATPPLPRRYPILILLLLVLTTVSAGFSVASFRASQVRPANALEVDAPAELQPAIKSSTTRPQRADEPEQTSTAPSVAPTTAVPVAIPEGLVLGQDATAPSPAWSKPALLETHPDPVYGLPVTRMTSADGTRFNRNTYSRRQAENADGTAFLTYHGEAEYHVYDVETGALLSVTPVHPDGDPQWHPTNPDKLRHVAGRNSYTGSLELLESSVSSNTTIVLADLTQRVQAIFPAARYMSDRSEGSPSADGTRFAWIIYNDGENPIGIISYDLAADRILGSVPVDPSVEYRLDWVSASPTGRYVMAGFWEGTYVWDADMTNERLLFEGAEHSDIAIGPSGNDTYVYIDFTASSNGGWMMAVDLVTGEETRLFDLYDDANTSIHVSGKAYDKPGWVVMSTYNCKEPGAWSCEKVFAVNIADGTIINLAHTYNCGTDYWTETHAVTNRDLTRVYFNSDAGSCGTDAEVYQIDLPPLN